MIMNAELSELSEMSDLVTAITNHTELVNSDQIEQAENLKQLNIVDALKVEIEKLRYEKFAKASLVANRESMALVNHRWEKLILLSHLNV